MNKRVINLDLNSTMLVVLCSSIGSEFHSLGSGTSNAESSIALTLRIRTRHSQNSATIRSQRSTRIVDRHQLCIIFRGSTLENLEHCQKDLKHWSMHYDLIRCFRFTHCCTQTTTHDRLVMLYYRRGSIKSPSLISPSHLSRISE